jgi:hypothetical protein
MPVIGILMILMCLATESYAQEQTGSESAAIPVSSPTPAPSPSDTEIKKTLVRALDKVEAQGDEIKAKDAVIAKQDEAGKQADERDALKDKENSSLREAVAAQTRATDAANFGWAQDEKRVKELEGKLRKSDSKLKWMAAGGVIAIVATILLK